MVFSINRDDPIVITTQNGPPPVGDGPFVAMAPERYCGVT